MNNFLDIFEGFRDMFQPMKGAEAKEAHKRNIQSVGIFPQPLDEIVRDYASIGHYKYHDEIVEEFEKLFQARDITKYQSRYILASQHEGDTPEMLADTLREIGTKKDEIQIGRNNKAEIYEDLGVEYILDTYGQIIFLKDMFRSQIRDWLDKMVDKLD